MTYDEEHKKLTLDQLGPALLLSRRQSGRWGRRKLLCLYAKMKKSVMNQELSDRTTYVTSKSFGIAQLFDLLWLVNLLGGRLT